MIHASLELVTDLQRLGMETRESAGGDWSEVRAGGRGWSCVSAIARQAVHSFALIREFPRLQGGFFCVLIYAQAAAPTAPSHHPQSRRASCLAVEQPASF